MSDIEGRIAKLEKALAQTPGQQPITTILIIHGDCEPTEEEKDRKVAEATKNAQPGQIVTVDFGYLAQERQEEGVRWKSKAD